MFKRLPEELEQTDLTTPGTYNIRLAGVPGPKQIKVRRTRQGPRVTMDGKEGGLSIEAADGSKGPRGIQRGKRIIVNAPGFAKYRLPRVEEIRRQPRRRPFL